MKQILTYSALSLLLLLFWACGSNDNPVNQTGSNFDPFALWDTASFISLGNQVQCLAAKDTFLYAGTIDSGVYVSTNNGDSWALSTGLNTASARNVHTLLVRDSIILAGTNDRVYRSTNKGSSWASYGSGPASSIVYSFGVKDTNLFAGTSAGAFRSTDRGATWNAVGLGSHTVLAFGLKNNVLFVGTTNGVYKSTDNGTNWTPINTGLPGAAINALAVKDTMLFAGMMTYGIYRSYNDSSWTPVNDGLTVPIVNSEAPTSFFIYGSSIMSGWSPSAGVFLSVNNGASWVSANAGLPVFSAFCFTYNRNYLFIGGQNIAGGGVWRHAL